MRQNSESYANITRTEQISLLRRLSRRISTARDRVIFKLLLETGCTPTELIQLKPADFEFITCSLTIGSGSRKRRVKLPLELSLELNACIRKESEYLLSSRQAPQLTARRIMQLVKRIGFSLVGKELRARDLRTLAVSNTLAKTKSTAKAMEFSGTKTIKEKEFLAQDQLSKVIAGINNSQHSALLRIFAETGCEINELVNIRAGDIRHNYAKNSENYCSIRLGNKSRNRTIMSSISHSLGLDLKRIIEEKSLSKKEHVFSTRQSGIISQKRVYQLVRQYSQAAGYLGVSPRVIQNSSAYNSFDTVTDHIPEHRSSNHAQMKKLLGLSNFGASAKKRAYVT